MQAGRLTERIDIFRPTVSTNEYGEQVTELEQIDTCKATAEYISGASERDEQGKEIRYEDQYIFTVYFHVNVKPFDIIAFIIFSKCFICGLVKYKSKFNCLKNLYIDNSSDIIEF